jgi:hypothetical protein
MILFDVWDLSPHDLDKIREISLYCNDMCERDNDFEWCGYFKKQIINLIIIFACILTPIIFYLIILVISFCDCCCDIYRFC